MSAGVQMLAGAQILAGAQMSDHQINVRVTTCVFDHGNMRYFCALRFIHVCSES